MNKRIESLLPTPFRKQGRQIEADGEVSVFCDMYCKEQMIEFAELIVRECVHIAYNKMAVQKRDGIQPSAVCDAIKQHFGVEE